MSRLFLLLGLLLTIGLAGAAPAGSRIDPTSPEVSNVARELVCDCPDCGKQALDQCVDCANARKYRAVIASMLQQGKSKDEILNYFAATYGQHMLGNPQSRGWGRIAALVPWLAALAGLAVLALVFRAWRSSSDARTGALPLGAQPATPATVPMGPVEDARVAAALRDFDF